MSRRFCVARLGLYAITKDLKSYANICHLLLIRLLPEIVTILYVQLLGVFQTAWHLNTILNALVLRPGLDCTYDDITLAESVGDPPSESRLVINTFGNSILGKSDGIVLLQIGQGNPLA